MNNWNRNMIVFGLMILTATACGKKKSDDGVEQMGAVDDVVYATESATNSIAGFADEVGGEPSPTSKAEEEEIATTMSTSVWCPRPAALTSCQADVPSVGESQKSQAYNGCVIPWTAVTATGNVALTYNNAVCGLSNSGDQVRREYDMSFAGIYGRQLKISSQAKADYRGIQIGGGGILKREMGGWSIELQGRHEQLIGRSGDEVVSVSLRTLPGQNIQIAGTLNRSNRTVTSGAFEVNHNRAEFTATFEPKNLHWDRTCCHPISGGFDVTYAGKISGQGSVEFTSCGKAKITKNDGTQKEVTLRACE